MCSAYKKTTHKKFITVEHIDCIMHARKANYKDHKKFYGSAQLNRKFRKLVEHISSKSFYAMIE